MRTVFLLCLAAVAASCSSKKEELKDELFVGVFESETRENFGSDTPGEWRIEITSPSQGKYVATLLRGGELLGKDNLVPCAESNEDYLRGRPSGRAEVLCMDLGGGMISGFIAYSENGIEVPAAKQKYMENPGLVQQEGLKPGDPALFEMRHHHAKYYAHAQWAFYGFRKVAP